MVVRESVLHLDSTVVRRARTLARRAGQPVVRLAKAHTTVSVERATLRLAGLAGADHEGQPWVNHLVDAVRDSVGLEHGVTTPVFDALRRGEARRPAHAWPRRARPGRCASSCPAGRERVPPARAARAGVATGIRRIDAQRRGA